MDCYQITIRGKVQGVFFRANTKNRALKLGLKGWVKNQPDGSVLIAAEGPKEKLTQLIEWCHEGSTSSIVTEVAVKTVDPGNYASFEIRH